MPIFPHSWNLEEISIKDEFPATHLMTIRYRKEDNENLNLMTTQYSQEQLMGANIYLEEWRGSMVMHNPKVGKLKGVFNTRFLELAIDFDKARYPTAADGGPSLESTAFTSAL